MHILRGDPKRILVIGLPSLVGSRIFFCTALLSTERFGRSLTVLAETDSTMDDARAAAERVERFRVFDEQLLQEQHLVYDDESALLQSAGRRSQRMLDLRQSGYAQLLLADEINRAPAKVQSALLEVMQERQVTIGKQTFPVGDPFLVLATQNPIESEGTYPLPEAQVDRFMLKVKVGYPSPAEEFVVVERMLGLGEKTQAVLDPEHLLRRRRLPMRSMSRRAVHSERPTRWR